MLPFHVNSATWCAAVVVVRNPSVTPVPNATCAAVTRFAAETVTAQVGWTAYDRRRDFARADGSWVKPLMMFQPCFLAVQRKERMTAKSVAPCSERKPPEIF